MLLRCVNISWYKMSRVRRHFGVVHESKLVSLYSSILRLPFAGLIQNFLLEDYVYDIMYGGWHMLKYEHTYSCTTCTSQWQAYCESEPQSTTPFRLLFVHLSLAPSLSVFRCCFLLYLLSDEPTLVCTAYSQHKLLINGSSFSYIWMICKCCVSLACERGRIDNGMVYHQRAQYYSTQRNTNE